MIRLVVNFVNRDAAGVANDLISLNFLPASTPFAPIEEALRNTFKSTADNTGGISRIGFSSRNFSNDCVAGAGASRGPRRLDFQGVISEMSSVMSEYQFSVPAHFSLVIRSLGALEGTVIKVDPEFKVLARAYPHVVAHLIRDRSQPMRAILSSLILNPDGSVRWSRLQRLLTQAAHEIDDTPSVHSETNESDGETDVHASAGETENPEQDRAYASVNGENKLRQGLQEQATEFSRKTKTGGQTKAETATSGLFLSVAPTIHDIESLNTHL